MNSLPAGFKITRPSATLQESQERHDSGFGQPLPSGFKITRPSTMPASQSQSAEDASGPGVMRTAGDLGVSLGQGVLGLAGSVAQIPNMATFGGFDRFLVRPVANALNESAGQPVMATSLAEGTQQLNSALDTLKSDELRKREQELADTEGFLPSAGKVLTDPRLLSSQVVQQIPNLIGVAGAARGAAKYVGNKVAGAALERGILKRVEAGFPEEYAATLARPAAQRMASTAGQTAAKRAVVASSGVLGAGSAAEQAQQDVLAQPDAVWDANPEFQSRLAAGESRDEAKHAMAITAGQKAALIAGPLSAAAGMLSAGFEAKAFTGALPTHGLGGVLSRQGAIEAGKAIGKEAGEETLQEGSEQLAQNVGVQGVDPSRDLMQGVPEAAGVGAALGGLMGGVIHTGGALLQRPVRFPDAQAGSLQDAGNAVDEAGIAPVAQAAPGPVVDEQPQPQAKEPVPASELMARAQRALDRLNAKAKGTPDTEALDPQTGEMRTIKGIPPRILRPEENELRAFLAQNLEDPAALANRLGVELAQEPAAEPPATTEAAPSPPQSVAARAPFVAVPPPWLNQETGELGSPRDANELVDHLASQIRSQLDAGRSARLNTKVLSGAWGIPVSEIRAARNAALKKVGAGKPDKATATAIRAAEAAHTQEDLENILRGPAEEPSAVAPVAPTASPNQPVETATQEPQGPVQAAPAEASPAAAPGAEPTYDESTEVLDTDITPPSGGVFVNRGAADLAAKRTGQAAKVVPVDGGFVVRNPIAGTTLNNEAELPAATDQPAEPTQTPAIVSGIPADVAGAGVAPNGAGTPKPGMVPVQKVGREDPDAEVDADNAYLTEQERDLVSLLDGRPVGATAPTADETGKFVKQADGRWSDGRRTVTSREIAKSYIAQDHPLDGAFTVVDKPGTPKTPALPAPSVVDAAANEAATSAQNNLPQPTEAQKEAGNYKKGHVRVAGHDITIENPAGSKRRPEWPPLANHYGYFKGTVGKDKDHVDVFLTDQADDTSKPVFVVDQVDPKTGKFDEHKVVMGAANEAEARAVYAANYAKDWKGLAAIREFTQEQFKAWVNDPAATKVPATITAPKPGEQLPSATAPEHVATTGHGMTVDELRETAALWREHIDSGGDADVTHIFDAPAKSEVVRLADKVKVYHKDHGWMTVEQAKAKIDEWENNALKQGRDDTMRSENSQKVVLSLFDLSGKWSLPWEQAGYQVFRFDIQDESTYEDPETGEERKVGDIRNMSVEFFTELFGNFDGLDVHAVLAACPCTDFAVSGARHFAAKDADGRTVSSVKLVEQTLAAIEYFKPAVWAIENPVGRIEELTGIPPWRLSFDPNHVGDPYTKKTLIWGRFNADLPIAPVEPTEGSKMHKLYGGKSMKTKNARSQTPEGFAYAFFQANNAIDHPLLALAGKYDRLDRAVLKQALDAGLTPLEIDDAVENEYYQDLDDQAAESNLRQAIAERTPEPSPPKGGTNVPQAAIDALAEYGYSVKGNQILTPSGALTRVALSKGAKARLFAKGTDGEKLWSGAPENIGDFLESFWFAKKKAAAVPEPTSVMSDAEFAENLPTYIEQYRVRAEAVGKNPDYFNADLAKDLFPEYNASNEARRDNNEKVSPRASKIAFTAFEQRLNESPAPNERVTLMAGGTGSGKSALRPDHGIVYDSTMYDPASAKRNVELVLGSGRSVDYGFVFNTPERAFLASIQRGKDRGRFVNMTAFVRTHAGAHKAAQDLMADYAGNTRVKFQLFDNTDFAARKIESLPDYDYNGLRERIQAILDTEYQAGRVSPEEYKAIARTEPPARGNAGVAGQALGVGAEGRPGQSEGLVDAASTESSAEQAAQTPPTGGVSVSGIRIAKAFSADSYKANIRDFAMPGTVGGWRVLALPNLNDHGTEYRLANSWNSVSGFASEADARAWAKLHKANPRGYFVETQGTEQSAKQAKAAQAEAERSTYRDLLADADMIGKSEQDLAVIIRERTGGTEAAAAKMAKALHREIAHKAAETEKNKHRDPAVLSARIEEGLRSASINSALKRDAFSAGFMHALAGKTKSTLAGEWLDVMQSGYADAKAWLRTEEGKAFYEGRPAQKLKNTGADLRRWFEQLKAEAEAAKTDGQKLWAAIKKQTNRASLFPITPPDGATPGVTRLLEHARGELAVFADYLAGGWRDAGFDAFVSADGRRKPGIYNRRRRSFGTTVDERMGEFIGHLLSPDYRFRRDFEAPKDQWVKDPMARGQPDRLIPPIVPMTEAQQRDGILAYVRDYVDGVSAWHAGLSKATTAQEGVDIAAALIAADKGRYASLFGRPVGGKPRSDTDPMSPYVQDGDLTGNIGKSIELQRIVRDDVLPIASKGDRSKPITAPRLDHVTRNGMPDRRNGKDVTPQEFKETFGFADVGFGNWVGAKQDQEHLNYAYDAFFDLATHFGIPSNMIGFDGKLHFTIGALGHGSKAAAHFQRAHPHPDGGFVPVINVTNTKGDGTIFHEWTHAFDILGVAGDWPAVRAKMLDMLRYKVPTVAEINGVAKSFLIGSYKWNRGRYTKVEAAIKALQPKEFKQFSATNTDFFTNARKLDGSKNPSKPYWSNNEELLARSAEAWASDTLKGINTYLVNSAWVGDGKVSAEAGHRGTPYPRGAERELVAKLWGAVAMATTIENGTLNVRKAVFDDQIQPLIEEAEMRLRFLRDPANMQAYYEELVSEQEAEKEGKRLAAEEKARAEAEETKRLAEAAMQQFAAILPTAAEALGDLTDNDLEAIFDEAAAELRESTFEEPDAPAPGDAMLDLPDPEEGAVDPVAPSDEPAYTQRSDEEIWNKLNFTRREKLAQHAYGGMRRVVHRIAGSKWGSLSDGERQAMSQAMVEQREPNPALRAKRAQAQDKTAAKMVSEAAKLGVTGLDEAMKGLVKLFGGRPGQLNSFPAGFDEETYTSAKPHFKAALAAFQEAGKTLKDLFKFLIQQFGDGVKMYAIQFAKEEGLTSQLGSQPTGSTAVAVWVQERLAARESIDWRALFETADTAFGGTQAEGKYTPKDAYDALEAGVNGYILANPRAFDPQTDPENAIATIAVLDRLLHGIPTQTKRTAEQDAYQQFSTVPPLAYAANWVANITAQDTMLEPSAGIGGLAVFAKNAGATLVLNELSSRRAAVLQEVFPAASVYRENAEQLDNILPAEVVPSVVVMNPPFSSSATRGDSKNTSIGAQHVEQALERLSDGGRLVAIVGDGMRWDAGAFKKWWAKISQQHNVRAVIPMSGKGYAKYGTTFDNVLLVIDKVAPSKDSTPLTTPIESYNQLIGLLSEIRNDRQPASVPAADRGAIERDAALTERDQAAQAAGESARPGGAGSDGVGGGKSVRGSAASTRRTGRGSSRGATKPGGGVRAPDDASDGDGADAGGSGRVSAGESERRDRRSEPAGGAQGVSIEAADVVAPQELTDAIFEGYSPQRLKVEGAKPHPGPLVQSSAMASVVPPAPTYTPNLPAETIEKGLLSLAQIEAVVYAGQAHEQTLPTGERRGFFIGDGTGVGKGREISGILLDNLRQGRKKAVWVSEKPGLLDDAKRDFKGVGGDEKLIFGQAKTKAAAAIPGTGILFTTYSTLRSGAKGQDKGDAASKGSGKSRLDQLVQWLGEDFDGVIAFDEAHNAGNAIAIKGKRGKIKPSEQAKAVVELQKRLPNARVVYVSATGATEVSNLSFATRLGLWGLGTPFASVETFISQMASGGLANMELVARDMKQMGMYLARSLSFDGVSYSRLEHELTDIQRDIYDRLCDAWQVVLNNFEQALELTGAKSAETGKAKNPAAVSAARSAFWGTQQRFFNQVITAMQMPAVLEQMERDVADGKALVLQLVNTNEAAQERALAKKKDAAEEDGELEDLDLTPRDSLMQMVQKAFPVVQMQEETDAEGNKHMVPVFDSEGKPVMNRKAEKMRDSLLDDLANIRVPDGPLEMVLNHFGPDAVAEVTGRSRRVVRREGQDGQLRPVIENRGALAARADADAFMADKKKILIFSDAGGTGYSFHADRTKINQRKRAHYLIQPGWRANKAVQGFGRSHRTNQASAPHYYLASTNIPAHKRFLSSIARRLDQLGALTKGQRDTASQGMFDEKDNLESIYAEQAVKRLMVEGLNGRVPGFMEILEQMGLTDIIDPNSGQIAETKIPSVSKFLNRMLSLKLDTQTLAFDAFIARMEQQIEMAVERGELDAGMQTIKAIASEVVQDEVIFTDPRTKAQTNFIELKLTVPNKFYDFPKSRNYPDPEWMVNKTSGRVYLRVTSGDETLPSGEIVPRYQLRGTSGSQSKRHAELFSRTGDLAHYNVITEDKASALWAKENAERPATVNQTTYLITGAVLPIWDRLDAGGGSIDVVRTQTVDGRRLLGRQIKPSHVKEIRKRFDISSAAAKMSPADAMKAILQGQIAELSNGWKLQRAKVSDELRIELSAGYVSAPIATELVNIGLLRERIDWKDRFFVPVGATGVPVLEKLLSNRPMVDLVDPNASGSMRLSTSSQAASDKDRFHFSAVSGAIRKAVSGWGRNAPSVHVVPTVEQLPREAKDHPVYDYRRANAFYDGKAVWIVANKHASPKDALRSLAHEAIGHYGIERILNEHVPGGWTRLVKDIERLRADRTLGSKALRDVMDRVERFYATKDASGNRVPADPTTFAKEMIAIAAERNLKNGLIARVVSAIRAWLRTRFPGITFGQADIVRLIAKSEQFLRAGPSLAERRDMVRQHAFGKTSDDTFYSAMLESAVAARGAPRKAGAAAWKQWMDGAIRRGEFKQGERDWLGVDAWLDGRESTTREELADFIRANQVQVQDVVLSDADKQAASRARGLYRQRQVQEDKVNSLRSRATDDMYSRSIRDEAAALLPDAEKELMRLDVAYETANRAAKQAIEQDTPTKFASYQLPGGENYRELLLTLPEQAKKETWEWYDPDSGESKQGFATQQEAYDDRPNIGAVVSKVEAKDSPQNYRSNHFDQPNILAHVRFNERTDADGKKVLFIEEIQSDWHQSGRSRGYNRKATAEQVAIEVYGRPYASLDETARYAVDSEVEGRNEGTGGAAPSSSGVVPDGPFKRTDEWAMLAFKRMVRWAAENGFDRIGWTTGAQQAERYDLSKQVSQIRVVPGARNTAIPAGSRFVEISMAGGQQLTLRVDESGTVTAGQNDAALSGKKLDEVVGKEVADKIMAADKETALTGGDLRVGGEGMRAFYDSILPKTVNKWAKKFGGKVGQANINGTTDEGDLDVVNDKGEVLLRTSYDSEAHQFAREHPGSKVVPSDGRPTGLNVHSIDITPTMRDAALAGLPLFRLAPATDSPAFKQFFANSKVVDAEGQPLVVHHGTGSEFEVFSDAMVGSATEHSTSPLGHFFAENLALAQRHAENASEGRPADERVISAYLSIQKPYNMTLAEAHAIDDPSQARALRKKLAAQGYDGIRIKEAGTWIVFESGQAKSVDNRGTFDRSNPNINFSLGDAGPVIENMETVIKQPDGPMFERAKAWIRGKAEDLKPTALGALQLRHVLELAEDHDALRGAREFADLASQMSTDRQMQMVGTPNADKQPGNMLAKGVAPIAEEWAKFERAPGIAGWLGRKNPESKALTTLMHEATQEGLDPAKEYQRLTMNNGRGELIPWTKEDVKERLKGLRLLMLSRAGDDKTELMEEAKYLRGLRKREAARERAWPALVAKYQALSPAAKAVYGEVRDWYSQHREAVHEALVSRIDALELPDKQKRHMKDALRLQFESSQVEGVYFPLDRNGEYWISVVDKDGNQGYKMFESAADLAKAEKKLRAAGYDIAATGRKDMDYRAKNAPSGTFIADIMQPLIKSGAPEKVMDEIYQVFLKALPEMSMRKRFVHRKAIPGFSDDALRAFAKNGFHGAHQLSKLRYGHRLEAVTVAMAKSMDNFRKAHDIGKIDPRPFDVTTGDALLGEIKRRLDWVMDPKDSNLANKATAIGFMYYLGASPAAAVVNLSQGAQVTLPVLGAKYGWAKASRVLGKATLDALRTGGNILNTLTSDEERQAFRVLEMRGDIDRTQQHTLAGLAEGNELRSNPAWTKTMQVIGYLFHKAEIVNREAAGIAAYRLARADGKNFEEATQYASDIINGTHFDYSSANRPRFMQGNVTKVAMQFKNYSVGMTWMLYRNLYQAVKGQDVETRRLARRTLTGVLGMTSVFAGVMGLPIINLVKLAANAAHAGFGDDDDPWDFDTEFRAWLAEHFGSAAGVIADGAINPLGADIASRVKLSDLWFRDADRELEGRDAYYQLLESIAGPMGGMVKNFYVGQKRIADGQVWRGVETMLPKFTKDAMKAMRYAHEGVNSLRGDPILPDVGPGETLMQGIGFRPTRVADQQRLNNALKGYEQHILDRRSTLLNAFAMSVQHNNPSARTRVLAQIQAFNRKYPEIPITTRTIRQSMQRRQAFSEKAEAGIVLNRKLGARVRDQVGAAL